MKFFRIVLVLFHCAVLALLFMNFLNAWIPPSKISFLNALSLAFPALMLINVALCLLWILLRKKRAIFFILLSLLFLNPVKRWVNYTSKSELQPNLKIVTGNFQNGKLGYEKINSYLEKTDSDIIFAQEAGWQVSVPGFEYRLTEYPLVTLHSKFKILHHEKISTFANGSSFYADLDIRGKTVRLVNAYLDPFELDKRRVKPTDNLDQNERKLRYVLGRFFPTFKTHQKEITAIRKVIDTSPYPVILAGDFNAVPNSYEYYQLGKNLNDAFMKVGRGSATSFHDYKVPLRIDYIFTSDEIKAVNYQVDRNANVSDHFPVIAEFKLD